MDDFEPNDEHDLNDDLTNDYSEVEPPRTSSIIGDYAKDALKEKVLNSQPVNDIKDKVVNKALDTKAGKAVADSVTKAKATKEMVSQTGQKIANKALEKGAEVAGGAATGGVATAVVEGVKLAKKAKEKIDNKIKELKIFKEKKEETEEEKKKKRKKIIIIILIICFILYMTISMVIHMETLTMDLENLILRREDRYKKKLIAFNDSEYDEVINKSYEKSTLPDNKSDDEKYEDPCYKRMLEYAAGNYDDIFYSNGKYELDGVTGSEDTSSLNSSNGGGETAVTGMETMLQMARKMSQDKPWSYGAHVIVSDKNKLYRVKSNDCSGFVASMYKSYFNMNVGNNSSDIMSKSNSYSRDDKTINGYKVKVGNIKSDCSNLKPGDILWRSGHVGIYYGNGYQIDHGGPGSGPNYKKVSAKRTPYTKYIRYYKNGGNSTNTKGNGYKKVFTSSSGYTYKEYKQDSGGGGSYTGNGYGVTPDKNGNRTIAHNGCGPTAVAIAMSGLGKNVDPGDVAKKMGGAGTETDKFKLKKIVEQYGFNASIKNDPSKSQLKDALNKGKPVICSVNSSSGNFTGARHIMTLLDVRNNDSEVYVSNPNSKRNGGWVKFNTLYNALNYIVVIK